MKQTGYVRQIVGALSPVVGRRRGELRTDSHRQHLCRPALRNSNLDEVVEIVSTESKRSHRHNGKLEI